MHSIKITVKWNHIISNATSASDSLTMYWWELPYMYNADDREVSAQIFDYTFYPCFFFCCQLAVAFRSRMRNRLLDRSLMKGSEIVFELLVSRQHLQVLARNYCFPRPLEHKSTHVTHVSPPTDRAHRRAENHCVTLMDRVAVSRVQSARVSKFSIRFHRCDRRCRRRCVY